MRVLIYEPVSSGHRFAYLSHIIGELTELSEVTLATSPSAAASPAFAQYLSAYKDRFTVDAAGGDPPRAQGLKRAAYNFQALKKAVQRAAADHVYVPYADGLAQVAGAAQLAGIRLWPRKVESEALLLRGGYQYDAAGVRRSFKNRIELRVIAKGPWTRIHHLNPDDLTILQQADPRHPDRYALMPDPVEPPVDATRTEARERLGLPTEGRYVGCTGLMDRRKGIPLLIRAFLASHGRLGADDRLLLAGLCDDQVRSILAGEAAEAVAQKRILVLDRLLSQDEFGLTLQALDVVCTPYPFHAHSASIVIRAAACGRPVLGSAVGWMDRMIRQFDLGTTCNVRDHDEFCHALVAAVDACGDYQTTPAARRFVAFHSEDNFRAHFTRRLRERLGLAPSAELVSWESVIRGDALKIPRTDADGASSRPGSNVPVAPPVAVDR